MQIYQIINKMSINPTPIFLLVVLICLLLLLRIGISILILTFPDNKIVKRIIRYGHKKRYEKIKTSTIDIVLFGLLISLGIYTYIIGEKNCYLAFLIVIVFGSHRIIHNYNVERRKKNALQNERSTQP